MPDIKQSLKTYEMERKKISKDIEGVHKEIDNCSDRKGNGQSSQTAEGGLDKEGKKTKTGLYESILSFEEEIKAQAQVKYEIEYLETHLVNAQKEAEIYGERKKRLEGDLVRANKKPK